MPRLQSLGRFVGYGTALIGVAVIWLSPLAAGYQVWQGSLDERALINHGKVVPAELVSVSASSGDPRTGDGGGAQGEYVYQMLDGSEGHITNGYDRLDEIPGNGNDEILEVEYLPERPDVKRVKGTGSTNTRELKFWLGFKFLLVAVWFGGVTWLMVSTVRFNRLA